MQRFWALPLQRQILLTVLLLQAPILVAAIWAGVATLEERTAELEARARTVATGTGLYVTREVERIGETPTDETARLALDRAVGDLGSRAPLPEGAVVRVVSGAGTELARIVRGEPPVGPLGPKRVVAAVPIQGTTWTLEVELPLRMAVDQAASVWRRSGAIFLVGLVGWFIITYLMVRRFAAAVSHLDRTAQRIANGDFRPIEHMPMASREFVELQQAFDAMLKRFNESRLALDAQMAEERRMRTELESLQGQVIRQERLAAVGQLVSGVAHEINNPLQAILGFAELLQMEDQVPDSVKGDLRLIQKESARACGIIRNLAMSARQQTEAPGPVRLIDIVSAVAELRQRRLESEDIELRVDDQSRQHVMAVPAELQQVVLNFVVNAEHAVVASGRLPGRITVRTFDRDGQVVLEVEDTGPGVAPENEAKLFQPFFTTKPVGQGTGLGLSVSYGIIESLGGKIGYRRVPGGSIFFFSLPAVTAG